jgi:hypothetical protein
LTGQADHRTESVRDLRCRNGNDEALARKRLSSVSDTLCASSDVEATVGVYSVKSTTAASAAFFLTDSMPFFALSSTRTLHRRR